MIYNFEHSDEYLSVETLQALTQLAQWREQSNCKGKRRLFFAPNSERPQARMRREAKASTLCDCCTVKANVATSPE